MKWFKHISDSLDDPFIFDVVSRFGGDGYMVFFGVLEVLAREFDQNSPETCTVSDRFLTKKLQLSRHKLVKILSFFHEKERVFCTFADGQITINCPKFVDMCDEWTRKQLRSKSGVTPENLRHEAEEEVEEEKEEEIRTPPPPTGATLAKDPEQSGPKVKKATAKDRRAEMFGQVQAAYPTAFDRHLASETTGRNAYTADLQAHENHGFATEGDMHEHVLAQIRKASNSERWLEDDGKFIPGIGKFLKNRLWRGSFEAPDALFAQKRGTNVTPGLSTDNSLPARFGPA